jgi:putative restriction endonuclease
MTVVVSPTFTARTEASRRIYDLHGRPLQPRPGTELPAEQHRAWHEEQVFRSVA